jgi:SAM-dependent methyltransferase
VNFEHERFNQKFCHNITGKTNFLKRAQYFRNKYSEFEHCGSEEEPESSMWLTNLSIAMEEYFTEGITVLDYGSGIGRYADFLTKKLKKFKYFGVEKPNSKNAHGEKCIMISKKIFRYSRKIHFGLIGSNLEKTAIKNSEVCVLGSVFTHVDYTEVQNILSKLMPIVKNNDGIIIFSAFISDSCRQEGPGIYGFENAYFRSYFTLAQIKNLEDKFQIKITEKGSFLAQGENLHRIYSAENQLMKIC